MSNGEQECEYKMMESEQMEENQEMDAAVIEDGVDGGSGDSDHSDEIERQPRPSTLNTTLIRNRVDEAMKLLEGMEEKRTQLNWICLSIRDDLNSLDVARGLSSAKMGKNLFSGNSSGSISAEEEEELPMAIRNWEVEGRHFQLVIFDIKELTEDGAPLKKQELEEFWEDGCLKLRRKPKESLNEAREEVNVEREETFFSCSSLSSASSTNFTRVEVQMIDPDTESRNAERKSDGHSGGKEDDNDDDDDGFGRLVIVEENEKLAEEKEENLDNN